MELPAPPYRQFASDNNATVHPAVMAALAVANTGHARAYGDDATTAECTARFRDLFGAPVEVLLAWGGTGANVVGLGCLLRASEAVVCSAQAHIEVDEGGAVERIVGAKLIDLPTDDGKLRPEQVIAVLGALGDPHHVQPKVVSITQSTELGTLYTAAEIAALAQVAHANGMHLHMDGARIANATVALGGDLRSFTIDAGVHVLSFGGTKNGMMYGEAVVFLRPELATYAPFVRKQTTQLPSKARFIAAQFNALLHDDLWLANARHANAMADALYRRTRDVPGVTHTTPPSVNALFPLLRPDVLAALAGWSFFYPWNPVIGQARWMTSFDTTQADVESFAAGVRAAASR